MLKKILAGPIDWFLFQVLSEKQRTAISGSISPEFRAKLKKILLGKKARLREELKTIQLYLYNLGFVDKALQDLEDFYEKTKDPYMKRLAAWELILWYANKHTVEDAKKALTFFTSASNREKDKHQLRRLAIMEAECLHRVGETVKATQVIEDMVQQHVHPDLYLAMVNLVEDIDVKLTYINKVYQYYNLPPISLANISEPKYDDLISGKGVSVEKGPKVSVILPAYNAEDGIQTAIESILGQTWKNIELLVVDDCSTDNTKEVVMEYANRDNRVKVLSTPINSGPYIARNIALKEATGEYVTINDSDDWSHAKKIEIQVNHLINNSHFIANTSEHARLTEDFLVYRRGTRGKYIFPNMSSIMFRRKPIVESLGYWDSVRFAADGEFKRRLIKVFGKDKYVDLKTGPLSLPRQTVSSLTGSSAFGYNGFFMGARKEYVDALEYYHKHTDSLYYPPIQEARLFPVPEPMLPARKVDKGKTRHVDIVLVSDYRYDDSCTEDVFNRYNMNEVVASVGLVQMNQYDLNKKSDILPKYRSKVDGNKVQMLVYGENIACDKLIVTNPDVLEVYQKFIPTMEVEQVEIILHQSAHRSAEEQSILINQISRYVTYQKIIWTTQ